MTDSALDDVRSLFAREQSAVLCSAHAGLAGWPYGSIVPYAMSSNGDLVVFLSDIAEHTRNLLRDPRATVFLADPDARAAPQGGARHAMLVRATRPEGAAAAAAEACYFARFPEAEAMRDAHGFAAWVLEVERIRWIAGFGAMGWIDRASWSGEPDPLAGHAADIVAHMNADHADAMALMVAFQFGIEGAAVSAVGVDRGGLEVEVARGDGRKRALRLPFAAPANTPDEARQQIVAMVRQARAARG